jgi:adenylate cyclase
VQQAVLTAQDIQRRWAQRTAAIAAGGGASIGLGIGIHTGLTSIGEIGTAYKDFTVVGPVVNMASRIQAAAKAGEILTSGDVYERVADTFPRAESRECQLKGFDLPVTVHPLPV